MRALSSLIQILTAALILLSVVAIGGRPGAFPDTIFYYGQGEAVAARLGLIDAARAAADGASDPTSVLVNAQRAGPTPLDTVLGARSASFGALFYGLHHMGGLWLFALFQALIAAVVLFIAVRLIAGEVRGPPFQALVAGLALTSSLPFLTGFAMPDLLTGLMALAAALMMTHGDRVRGFEAVVLIGALALGVASHSTDLILSLVILSLGLVRISRSPAPRRGAGLTAGGFVLGLAVAALATQAASWPGHPQSAPPFLTARVLADGPGRLYLKQACAAPRAFALCAYRGQALDKSEAVLWNTVPGHGVFGLADVKTRQALQAEQSRFTTSAVLAHPGMEAVAALRNIFRQLLAFTVDDELRNDSDFFNQPFLARTRLPQLIPDMTPCRLPLESCANHWPFNWLSLVQRLAVLAAIGLIGWRWSQPGFRSEVRAEPDGDEARLFALIGLLIAAILANAVICGGVSGPFSRYGARVIWLAPLAGGLILSRLIRRKTA